MGATTLCILGSTGSIGTQALDILNQDASLFNLYLISAQNSWELLAEQIISYQPKHAVICNDLHYEALKNAVQGKSNTQIHVGKQAILDLIVQQEVDLVLNALVGFAGFEPTMATLKAGKRLALANKESLVVGGQLVMDTIKNNRNLLLPVDSEHSAMLQCLVGENQKAISKIIITASGGPFRTWTSQQMQSIKVEDALAHPNWSMGAKITIDSATMMNKGLEVIEAYWLFDVNMDQIVPVVHPQSIVHSMIEFVDGSSKAQLGPPDMKVPIAYALTYPERKAYAFDVLDWTQKQQLDFEPVDHSRFPCLNIAKQAALEGGFATTVLNAANEVAVQRFLDKELAFTDIPKIIEKSLDYIQPGLSFCSANVTEVDRITREYSASL